MYTVLTVYTVIGAVLAACATLAATGTGRICATTGRATTGLPGSMATGPPQGTGVVPPRGVVGGARSTGRDGQGLPVVFSKGVAGVQPIKPPRTKFLISNFP
jgi:hypothetical protein